MSLLDAMSWEENMLAAHLMMERAAKLPAGDPKARELLHAARILLSGDPPNDRHETNPLELNRRRIMNLHNVLKAAHTAALWHSGQARKGVKRTPYINHLLEVSQLVASTPEGRRDENVIIAALLHDAIEDQQIRAATIAEMFSWDVAKLVLEVTDDKLLNKQVRKDLQIINAPDKSPRAALIKLADKISNVSAVADDPPVHWELERRITYIEWSRAVVRGLPPTSPSLLRQFEEAAANAESKF